MSDYLHGLVLGKFYPPHVGHHALIEHAAGLAQDLTVVVMASSAESISLADRVGWLRAAHASQSNVTVVGVACDIPFDMESPAVWAAQVALVKAALPSPVDAVFSSEGYGEELAARLGARHEAYDPTRHTHPISGTACRADLPAMWENLHPVTRAGLATRIVVVGAESTGTTTLSKDLAGHYRNQGGVWEKTGWVPEYGREFTYVKLDRARASGVLRPSMGDLTWASADFDEIAEEQNRTENLAAAHGSPLVVCDTDSFATALWERRYLRSGPGPERLAAMTGSARRDVYLLTDHEGVPFEQDGIRDGETVRQEMTGWFKEALTDTDRSWVLMTGNPEERLDLAVRVTDLALHRRLTLHDPI